MPQPLKKRPAGPAFHPLAACAAALAAAVLMIGLLLPALPPAPALAASSHRGRFEQFQGPATCLACHREEALEVHGSVHYQWQGDSRAMVNPPGPLAGKLGGINDFCVYPDINWISRLTNLAGEQVPGGCSKCHVGLGEKPEPEPTQAQLENIDCLVCHSDQYRRTVSPKAGGGFEWVADLSRMEVDLTEAAWNVTRPSTASCLACHALAGGGDNYKRGDLALDLLTASRDFDVHLASAAAGGAGLNCLSCHQAQDHRIPGRGSDLRPLDTTVGMACTDCHNPQPHRQVDLDRHTGRVDCTVCHIPSFSKLTPTEMERDWSAPGEVVEASGLIEPRGVKQAEVTPVYRFFNGTSRFYNFGQEAQAGESGRIVMSEPVGRIDQAGVKLHPFKLHLGNQPLDPLTRRLLPLKIGIFFQTGDVAAAVAQGRAEVGWPDNGFEFAATERYMALNHEVVPKERALACAECHSGGTRLDFTSLGYAPRTERNGRPLCLSCHGNEDDEWSGRDYFQQVHRKHAREEGLNCAECHLFSAASSQAGGGGSASGGDDREEDD